MTVGELGILLADSNTYREAIKMSGTMKWEATQRVEIKQLEQLRIFSDPRELWANMILALAISKNY